MRWTVFSLDETSIALGSLAWCTWWGTYGLDRQAMLSLQRFPEACKTNFSALELHLREQATYLEWPFFLMASYQFENSHGEWHFYLLISLDVTWSIHLARMRWRFFMLDKRFVCAWYRFQWAASSSHQSLRRSFTLHVLPMIQIRYLIHHMSLLIPSLMLRIRGHIEICRILTKLSGSSFLFHSTLCLKIWKQCFVEPASWYDRWWWWNTYRACRTDDRGLDCNWCDKKTLGLVSLMRRGVVVLQKPTFHLISYFGIFAVSIIDLIASFQVWISRGQENSPHLFSCRSTSFRSIVVPLTFAIDLILIMLGLFYKTASNLLFSSFKHADMFMKRVQRLHEAPCLWNSVLYRPDLGILATKSPSVWHTIGFSEHLSELKIFSYQILAPCAG